jgi:hypothetical protein
MVQVTAPVNTAREKGEEKNKATNGVRDSLMNRERRN